MKKLKAQKYTEVYRNNKYTITTDDAITESRILSQHIWLKGMFGRRKRVLKAHILFVQDMIIDHRKDKQYLREKLASEVRFSIHLKQLSRKERKTKISLKKLVVILEPWFEGVYNHTIQWHDSKK